MIVINKLLFNFMNILRKALQYLEFYYFGSDFFLYHEDSSNTLTSSNQSILTKLRFFCGLNILYINNYQEG